MIKWFLLILLYRGPELEGQDIYFGKTEEECREAKALALEKEKPRAAKHGLDLRADCYQITQEPPPKVQPSDPASEVKS